MTISELKVTLNLHSEKKLRFVLPDKHAIPAHFHITEVGYVSKDFIDCGGTERHASTCVLQAWVAKNDEDHSLEAGKLGKILGLASKVLPNDDLMVEVEFEAPYISQFPIGAVAVAGDALVFQLTTKHTDCLAKEQCGLEGTSSSCCSEESGCC